MSDGLSVHGGAGGTTAWLDDLDAAAHALARAGAEVTRVAAEVAWCVRDPALALSVPIAPWTGLRAESQVLAAAAGPQGLAVCALRLEGLAGAVLAAVTAYRACDAAVAATLHALDLAAGRLGATAAGAGLVAVAALAGPSLAGGFAAGTAGPVSPAVSGWLADQGARLLSLLGRHPVVSEHLVGALPGAIGALLPGPVAAAAGRGALGVASPGLAWSVPLAPADPRDAALLISRLGQVCPWLREPGRVRLAVGSATPVRPAAGVGDLLYRVGTASPGVLRPDGSVAAPGTVRVERVVGGDGSRRWVVEIPGTHDWSPSAGADPFDLTSDVRTLGGRSSAVQQTVVEALAAVGAGPDEPVLLVGHSLGGMAAAQLAADPQVRQRFRITDVVTAGSPIALSRVPPDVHVLSLEHTDDLVPRLDGTPNPDRPGWATVSRPSTPVQGEDAAVALVRTHDIGAYLRTGALVDASTDPAVVAARQHLAPFLDAPGRTATAWDVQGTRILPSANPAVNPSANPAATS